MPLVVFAHMVQRAGHPVDKSRVGGHALGADRAGHPLAQTVAQHVEVLAVAFRREGLVHRIGVDGADHGFAVVFVEAWPDQGLQIQAGTLANAFPRLGMAAQAAHEHGVEALPPVGPVAPQPLGLALAQLAELIVVGGAKRGLAMAHEVEVSHAGILAPLLVQALSRQRLPVAFAPHANTGIGANAPGCSGFSGQVNVLQWRIGIGYPLFTSCTLISRPCC